jgi:hypothetical protein
VNADSLYVRVASNGNVSLLDKIKAIYGLNMGSPRTYLVKFTVRAYRTCMVVTIKLPSV